MLPRLPLVVAAVIHAVSPAVAADHMAPPTFKTLRRASHSPTSPSGTKLKMTFSPDGKMDREPDKSSGAKDTGTWTLSANGFCGFCTTWTRSKPNCL